MRTLDLHVFYHLARITMRAFCPSQKKLLTIPLLMNNDVTKPMLEMSLYSALNLCPLHSTLGHCSQTEVPLPALRSPSSAQRTPEGKRENAEKETHVCHPLVSCLISGYCVWEFVVALIIYVLFLEKVLDGPDKGSLMISRKNAVWPQTHTPFFLHRGNLYCCIQSYNSVGNWWGLHFTLGM